MAEGKNPKYLIFRGLLVVGLLLAITLLVQSIRTYQIVSNSLIVEELNQHASREALLLGYHANRSMIRTRDDLSTAMNELVADEDGIAWLRLLSSDYQVIASSDSAKGEPAMPPQPGAEAANGDNNNGVSNNGNNNNGPGGPGGNGPDQYYEIRGSGADRVLVTLRPFRRRGSFGRLPPDVQASLPNQDGVTQGGGDFPQGRGGFGQGRSGRRGGRGNNSQRTAAQADAGQPQVDQPSAAGSTSGQARPADELPGRGGMVEVAVYWESADTEFMGELRHNLIIQVSASIALLGAVVFLGLRFRGYMRGKQLEQQLELARNVQQGLLPSGTPESGPLDVAALCDPAWQVGGDIWDVFQGPNDRVALLLGDVSGKGLPASLLMGLLHGAVRSSDWTHDTKAHENASAQLNNLLCMRTSVDRFASMFWCYYDPEAGTLNYVNAGHLAPFVVTQDSEGKPVSERLEEGGPVLGVIPNAQYRQGSIPFRPGDLLVLYSDGVVEAANRAEEEYGEERLARLLLECANMPAEQIRDEILRQVESFLGDEQLQDDLTLLVVRAGVKAGASGGVKADATSSELVQASS